MISSIFTLSYLNEYDPEIINLSNNYDLPENSVSVPVATFTTRDNDTDSLSGTISSTVEDTSGGFFDYKLTGDDLSIVLKKKLDYETATTLNFTITIKDKAPSPFERSFTFDMFIKVLGVDDECPYLEGVDPSTVITLYEHDTVAAKFNLTDLDTDDSNLTLSVIEASPASYAGYVTVDKNGVFPGTYFSFRLCLDVFFYL